MRLFAAIPVDSTVSSELAAVARELARGAPGLRPARPDGMHITLKFFGEQPNEVVGSLSIALARAAAASAPFQILLGAPVRFPSRAGRILAVEAVQPSPEFTALFRSVNDECERIGLPREAREPRPHLTLVRGKSRISAKLLQAAAAAAAGAPYLITASTLVLFESPPERGGSAYLPVATFSLHDG
jgi:2'-5' RNA ligase